jgi:hypothetical protein
MSQLTAVKRDIVKRLTPMRELNSILSLTYLTEYLNALINVKIKKDL